MNKKRGYGIGQVARKLEIEPSTIRYWETKFGDLHSEQGAIIHNSEERRFSSADILRLKVIKALLTVKGFTIRGAKKELIELDIL